MERNVYASDGKIRLVRLTEEDKEKYMRLKRSVSDLKNWYDNPKGAELIWLSVIDGEDLDYSIYDDLGEYCGNVVLQNPSDETPEIGVDLVEEKRNQGVAAKAIKLLAKKAYEERPVKYFLLRVSSENPHSRHMIEKMGAVLDCKEESRFENLIKQVQETLGDASSKELHEHLRAHYGEDTEEEVVYQYRLLPEIFLEK